MMFYCKGKGHEVSHCEKYALEFPRLDATPNDTTCNKDTTTHRDSSQRWEDDPTTTTTETITKTPPAQTEMEVTTAHKAQDANMPNHTSQTL